MSLLKKASALGMAVLMAAGLMSCTVQSASASKEEGESVESASEMSAEGSESNEEAITIEFWHKHSDQDGGTAIGEILKEFNESQDKVIAEHKFVSGGYQGIMRDLQAEVAAGRGPEIVQVGYTFSEYFSDNFSYTPASELFVNYGSDEDKNFLDDTYEESIKTLSLNQAGDIVGFPYAVSVPVLYVNKDLIAEVGADVSDLKTWEGMYEVAYDIKEKTDKYGFYITEGDTWALQYYLESNGANFITDGKCSINSPEAVEAYQLHADAVIKDGVSLHADRSTVDQAFLQGELGMMISSSASGTNYMNSANFDLEIMTAPTWEGNELKLPVGGNLLAVTAASDEEKAAAAEVVKWLLSEENMVAFDTATGYIPPVKSAADSEMITENEMIAARFEDLQYATQWATFPGDNGLKHEQVLLASRDEIFTGTSVEESLKNAQDTINADYE